LGGKFGNIKRKIFTKPNFINNLGIYSSKLLLNLSGEFRATLLGVIFLNSCYIVGYFWRYFAFSALATLPEEDTA
jgi:hypothetical protein